MNYDMNGVHRLARDVLLCDVTLLGDVISFSLVNVKNSFLKSILNRFSHITHIYFLLNSSNYTRVMKKLE